MCQDQLRHLQATSKSYSRRNTLCIASWNGGKVHRLAARIEVLFEDRVDDVQRLTVVILASMIMKNKKAWNNRAFSNFDVV